ncbi:MAG: hypothetical protein KR126chlam1_00167 [Chlamydiae bacterium]|nr:hypothetical protein [Chlamydiota bacterium]
MAIRPDLRTTFQTEIADSFAAIYKRDKGNPGKNAKDAAKRAYEIFQNTLNSPLDFILIGPDQIRSNSELAENLGLIITHQKKTKRGKENEVVHGAILGESQWSLLINDAFILGAIHGHKEVFLLGKSFKIIEERDSSLTTLGREIALLQIAGYQRVATEEKELIAFQLPEEISAEDLTLQALWNRLDQFEVEAISRFFDTLECD